MTCRQPLFRLFEPASVAVVGASANPGAIGGQPIAHLQAKGFAGPIYPVNPKYETLAGLRCYPDLASLPETPDLLVVAIAASLTVEVVEAAGAKGIPFVVVLSSGFAEAGEEGMRLQQALAEAARRGSVYVIGPNCQGFMNVVSRLHVGFGAPYALDYRPGNVSLTSQSGAFGNSLVMELESEGIGMRHYVSTGNETATTTLDFMAAFIDDSDTKVIAAYIEGLKGLAKLPGLAEAALKAEKPILIWKVGTSPAGARAARSHTANLAEGTDFAPEAFRRIGVIDVHDTGDMADCIRALAPKRWPRSRRVGVVTVSGGAGIAIADRCAHLEIELAELSSATHDRLACLLPDFASLVNPVDVTGSAFADPGALAGAFDAIADDPEVDTLLVGLAALSGTPAAAAAEAVAAIWRRTDIPILVAWNGDRGQAKEGYQVLEALGVPIYRSPVRCVRGFHALAIYAEALRGQTAALKAR